jgi:hypothetical protein
MYLQLAETEEKEINPYIFFPDFEAGSGGVYIREDKFDNMPTEQYKEMVRSLSPYQPKTSGGLQEERLLSSRAERKERRADKNKRKNEKAESKNQARASKEERKSKRQPFDFKGAIDSVGGVIKNFKGGNEQGVDIAPVETSKPFYTNPLFIGGMVAVLGAGIYFATKKK